MSDNRTRSFESEAKMKLFFGSMVLAAMGALIASCVPQTSMIPSSGSAAIHDHADLDVTLQRYRTAVITIGVCPPHTEDALRTIEVRNWLTEGLRVSFDGHPSADLVPSYLVFASAEVRARARVRYCVYAEDTGLLQLATVGSVGTLTRDPLAVPGIGAHFYQFPVGLGSDPLIVSVDHRTTSFVPQSHEETMAAIIRAEQAHSTRLEHRIADLTRELESAHAETSHEREISEQLRQTIHAQAEELIRMGHDLALSRSEAARLRTRLQDAEAQIRTMIPRDVYDALVNQRAGQHEYEWAMGAFSQTVSRNRNGSGFCHSVSSAAVGALPGLLLGLLEGPEGIFAGFLLDMLGNFLGGALSDVVDPLIDGLCS